MNEVATRMRGSVSAPLVFDSTELPVLESAMKLYGGKPVLNSINFEDGEEAAEKRLGSGPQVWFRGHCLDHRRRGHGQGSSDHKVEVAKRLLRLRLRAGTGCRPRT